MVRHQVVVHPQAAHGVVDGGIDAHRHLVGIFAGDALVHVEQVAVALLDDVLAEALDGVAEIEDRRRGRFRRRRGLRRRPALALREATSRGTRLPKLGYLRSRIIVALGFGNLAGERACRPSSAGTQTRPSLRSDSLIRVSFD